MGTAAVVETNHLGHHYVYLGFLVRADPTVVLLLTEEGTASREFGVYLAELVARFDVRVRVLPSVTGRRALLSGAARLAEEEGCDRLVFPEADNWLAALALAPARIRRRLGCSYLVMRSEHGTLDRPRSVLLLMAKGLLTGLVRWRWRRGAGYFLTDCAGVVDRRPFLAALRPLRDPQAVTTTLTRAAARQRMGLSEQEYVVGILGGIDGRKHPELVLGALAELPADVRVLLCGRLYAPVPQQIAALPPSLRKRVTTREGTLPDEAMATAIKACDAVAVLHDLDGPSGMLANALGLGVPVLVGESPWLRRVARATGGGVVADHDPASVAAAILTLRRSPAEPHVPVGTPEEFATRLLDPEPRR